MVLFCAQTLALAHTLSHLDADGYAEPDCAACTLAEHQIAAADPAVAMTAPTATGRPDPQPRQPAPNLLQPARFHARAPPAA